MLLDVEIRRAIASLIQKEGLPRRLGHFRKIRWLLNDLIARAGLDLGLKRQAQQETHNG
jgi:hypothetical protein